MSNLLYQNSYFNTYCKTLNCGSISQTEPISLFASNNGSDTYNESNINVPIEFNGITKYSNGIYLDNEDNRKIRFSKTGVYQFQAVVELNGQQTPLIDDATACYSLGCQFKQYSNDGTLKDYSYPYGTTFNISGSYFQSLTITTLLNIDDVNDYVILNTTILSNGGLNFNWLIQNCELKVDLFSSN